MSGHSKWANIKHKKDAVDRKRGKIFSRITRDLILAVRQAGAEVETNAKLRACLIAARAANMPKDNVERAIKKAAGDAGNDNFEEIMYEGYGPGGTAVLVECLSDNRNRIAGEVRMVFDRSGGNMANNGAVKWMFHRKARFMVRGENATEEKLFDIVIDAGAEDLEIDGDVAVIWGPAENFVDISGALEKAGIQAEEASLHMKPENIVEVTDPSVAGKITRLIEKLEELDDVQEVYSNFDFSDAVIEALSKEK